MIFRDFTFSSQSQDSTFLRDPFDLNVASPAVLRKQIIYQNLNNLYNCCVVGWQLQTDRRTKSVCISTPPPVLGGIVVLGGQRGEGDEVRGSKGRKSRPKSGYDRVGFLGPHQLGGLGERCKLPQRGLGRSSSRNRILAHFSLKCDT